MSNSFLLLMILVLGCLVAFYFALYKLMTKRIAQIKNYIEENGYSTKAEVMGHVRINRNKYHAKWIVLKFKDNFNIEHIVIQMRGTDAFFKYRKGDVLNIDYIEAEKVPYKSHYEAYKETKVKMCNKYFEKSQEEILLTDSSDKYQIIINDKPTRSSYKFMWLLVFSPAIIFIIFTIFMTLM